MINIRIQEITNNANFYSVLSGKYQEIYWEIAFHLFNIVSNNNERHYMKSILKQDIEKMLVEKQELIKPDSENEITIAKKGIDFINTLSDTGWIVIKYDEIKNTEYVSLTSYAYSFIRNNINYIKDAGKIKTGEYVTIIESTLNKLTNLESKNNEVFDLPYRNGIKRIYDNTINLKDEISKITEILNEKIQSAVNMNNLDDIIDGLDDFLKLVNNKYMENIYRYSLVSSTCKRKTIGLKTLINENKDFQKRLLFDIKDENAKNVSSMSDIELLNKIEDIIDSICDLFETCQQNKNDIENKKANIISTVSAKLRFLQSSNKSLPANVKRLNNTLSYISKEDDIAQIEEILNSAINIREFCNYHTDNPFYAVRYTSNNKKVQPVKRNIATKKDLDNYRLKQTEVCSINKANTVVNDLLGDKTELNIVDIENTEENCKKLMLVAMYADTADSVYGVQKEPGKVIIGDKQFDNFTIRRKLNGRKY